MKPATEELKKKLRERKPDPILDWSKGLSTGYPLLNLACTGRQNVGLMPGFSYLFVGDSDSGKAQPLDAKVLTPQGWKRMGELSIGDKVVDPSTTNAVGKVRAIFPQGIKETFTVTFSDGSKTRCCNDHLWYVKVKTRGGRGGKEYIVKSLREIQNSPLFDTRGVSLNSIPATQPIEFDSKESLPIEPYLLGTLLGNGHFGIGQVGLSSCESEIISKVRKALPANTKLNHRHDGDYRICRLRKQGGHEENPFLTKTRQLKLSGCLAKEKFIPKHYLRASIYERVRLLNGLMDTDGEADKQGSALYHTVSRKLAKGVVELVRSLGGRTLLRKKVYVYKGERRNCYSIVVTLPPYILPFTLKRKANRYRPYKVRDRLSRRIVSIVPSGREECQCISVTTKNGLYITDNYVVTHNSFVTTSILAEAAINPAYDHYRLIFNGIERGNLIDAPRMFGKKLAARIEPPALDGKGRPKYCRTIEDFYFHMDDLFKEGKPFIEILDSEDCLKAEADLIKFQEQKAAYRKGKETSGSFHAAKPKLNSQCMPDVIDGLARTQSILVVISQTRDNLGFSFDKKTRSGGRALTFYATVEMWSSVKELLRVRVKGKDRQIGIMSEIKVKRSRFTGKKRTIQMPILWSIGIDEVGGMIDWLIEEGHWEIRKKKKGEEEEVSKEKAKKSAIIVADEFKFEGNRDGLIRKIETDKRQKELRLLVGEVWNEIEAACSGDRVPRYQ